MLIPVHRVPRGLCKGAGRARAAVVAQAIVDDDMGQLLAEFWTLSSGYASTFRGGRRVFLHHVVAGRRPGLDVSHENANKLDCRRANLVHATRSDNMLNPADGAFASNASCGLRGVTRDDRGRKLAKPWRGKVQVAGKTHQTARYATAVEAAAALAELRRTLRVREFPAGIDARKREGGDGRAPAQGGRT